MKIAPLMLKNNVGMIFWAAIVSTILVETSSAETHNIFR
jgi:hypothetical protein